MVLKSKCCGHALVAPRGLVYDIKKDVLPLSLQVFPTPSGAAVGIGI